MQAGIPVINLDREFSDAGASRLLIKGDNYGMGVAAGTYIGQQAQGQVQPGDRRDRRHRQPAADPGPVARIQGRARHATA